MSLVVRVDATAEMGVGHAMRMIALAQAWLGRGGRALFVTKDSPESVMRRLNENQIEHREILDSDRSNESDAEITAAIAGSECARWVVVDGYHFDDLYCQTIRSHGLQVLVLDDCGHTNNWTFDALLNQNIYAESFEYEYRQGVQYMLGSKYALLRSEFLTVTRKDYEVKMPLRKILVTLGGGDCQNASTKIIRALNRLSFAKLDVRVIVGAANPHREMISSECELSPHKIEMLDPVDDMSAQYDWAHGVISAGGSTCWEWMRYGIPAVVVTIADNQRLIAKTLGERKIAVDLGWHESLVTNSVEAQLTKWVDRATSELKPSNEIDGSGAHRVAAMLDDGLWLRPADSGDVQLYFDWVNDPVVRKNSMQINPITWENHQSWFAKRIVSSKSRMFIMMRDDSPLGQVRFDSSSDGFWEIDFSIEHGYRGSGLGQRILELGVARLRQYSHSPIRAVVKDSNQSSARCFEKLGFAKEGLQTPGLLHYRTEEP